MADDHMLEQSFQLFRESGDGGDLRLQHLQFDDHMSQQLTATGVGKRAGIGELVNFSDVVEKRASEQQVAVDLRIVPADQIRGAHERDHVVEQASDIGVVHGLGRRGASVGGRNLRVGHKCLDQGPQVDVLERANEFLERVPQGVNVFVGFRKVIDKIYVGVVQAAQLVNGELEAILESVQEALHLEIVFLLEGVKRILDVVPHLGFDLSGAVAEGQGQIRTAVFLWFDLLGNDYEAGDDDFIFKARAVREIKILHDRGTWQTPRPRKAAK